MEKGSTDFLDISFQILELCGVCPYSRHHDFIPWTKKVLHIVLAFFPLYEFVNFIFFHYENDRDIFVFIHTVSSIIQWVSHFLAIIVPLVHPDAIVRVFCALEETQRVMYALGITEPVVLSNVLQQCYIAGFLVIPSLIMASLSCTFTFYNVMAKVVVMTVSFATLIKGKFMLMLIHKNFEALNDRLEVVCKQTLEAISKEKTCTGDFAYKIPKRKIAFACITVAEIHKFNQAHFRLCEAHQVVNELYSVQGTFMPLAATVLVIRMFISHSGILISLVHIEYGILYMFMFISFLTSATNARSNSLKTGYLIHELLLEEHPNEIEQELEFFSHILKHRKVQLSAEGFFILDLKILTKMMCTLVPLILILVQRKNKTITPRAEF